MADLHPGYAGSPFEAAVVVKARVRDSRRRWFSTAGTAAATVTGDPARPASWPLRWTCPHCGRPVRLDRGQARHVGRRHNIEVHDDGKHIV